MLSQANKNLLVAIYSLTQEFSGQARIKNIAASLGVTPSTVSEQVTKLSKKGYIKHETYKKAALTSKGRHIALQVLQRRSLISAFLQEVLHFSGPEAEEEACILEPVVSEQLAAALKARLGMSELFSHDRLVGIDLINNNI